ncbi:dihydroorotate dehydrogenase electron transfer subunit [Dysgonomonas sp. PFB1-18]|uniref:dihydroorotate dehydrogenase electron transfer subunit n=1 Tax=unclassified Dysgonomonas TaxID=2630389 RepID=UPI002476B475|nr:MULTISPECIES: dihydroorotate dehydrogenase electron transfer subunit [unclassified Dysgonomonas]MDH6308806.1 dihydroorotate dehydrogenase electron transfer subunit [Dysgonomonas sp. PF1-14]MDH6338497.1 dihydroorotate dehydrogenase electron transfer subunit [Dysgonomonas sp. PF1-16]MDH6380055.1 dihydroorotate dehydrogenase electron transfer subunit [Dysgonomonas sp. PFB1-18]MDH6397325.1 dihydroorotate dehydrogenase electron transfer subunit [Dysgonomonas sp. PF1-23]
MKKMLDLVVTENQQLNRNYCLLKLSTTDNSPLPEMFPGQFVEVRVDNSPTTYLRRPISVNFVDKDKNELWLLVQAIGDGTRKMCEYQKGDIMNLLLPLGNTFTLPAENNGQELLLIGGGVGTAPMLFLGACLKAKGYNPKFLLGARSKDDLLQLDDFGKYGEVFCTTEDGSYGEKGYVTDHSVLKNTRISAIYTCGPKPMMMAVARYANQHKIECQVSLENMMACGFGVCLCCVEKTSEGNVCVCTEGPVFNIEKLTWIN